MNSASSGPVSTSRPGFEGNEGDYVAKCIEIANREVCKCFVPSEGHQEGCELA